MTNGTGDGIPFISNVSPDAKVWIRRALGIGIGIYAAHSVIKSPEVKHLTRRILEWKNYGPPDEELLATGAVDVYPLVNGQSFPVSMLEMDPVDRNQFWTNLTRPEIRMLHLICRKFNAKLSNALDLHVNVNCLSTDQRHWVEYKSVQTCSVFNLGHICSWGFLSRPKVLKELYISQSFCITPNDLEDILDTFTNLHKLVAHVNDGGLHMDRVNSQMLTTLGSLRSLTLLSIDYIYQIKCCRWFMDFEQNSSGESVHNLVAVMPKPRILHLQFIHFIGPATLENSENRSVWKIFMSCQTQLRVLIVNCGPVPWSIYANVIVLNEMTLEKIEISNITNWADSSTYDTLDCNKNSEGFLDWNVFRNCKKLTHLTLIASQETLFGPKRCKPLRSGYLNLKSLELDMGAVHWSIYDSIINANALTLVSLNLSRLDNIDHGRGQHSVFDWSMLKYCKKLESLSLAGRQFSFLNHKNLAAIPKSISAFDLKWFNITASQLQFLAKNLPKFKPDSSFMQLCSVTEFTEDDSYPEVNLVHGQKSRFQKFREFYDACPVPILDTVTTLYLLGA